jgi:hypothetical protein
LCARERNMMLTTVNFAVYCPDGGH